eukprot:1159334-Pelagomonas_calceolata.AAC.3
MAVRGTPRGPSGRRSSSALVSSGKPSKVTSSCPLQCKHSIVAMMQWAVLLFHLANCEGHILLSIAMQVFNCGNDAVGCALVSPGKPSKVTSSCPLQHKCSIVVMH